MIVEEAVRIAENAISNKWLLLIDYVGKDLSITKDRLIEPQEIHYSTDGEPEFVWAHCYLRDDLRRFQFEGIQKATILTWPEAWDLLPKLNRKEGKENV